MTLITLVKTDMLVDGALLLGAAQNGGNTTGAPIVLGTLDNFPLVLVVNGFQSGYIDGAIGNTVFGYTAFLSNISGIVNTAIGYDALRYSTTGNDNIAMGFNALSGSIIRTGNITAFAANGPATTVSTGGQLPIVGDTVTISGTINYNGNFNVIAIVPGVSFDIDTAFIANDAMGTYITGGNTGSANIAIGDASMRYNTTGHGNIAMGLGALGSNTIGFENIAIGQSALQLNTTGEDNSAYGYQALRNNTTGSHNEGFGERTLYSNSTGDNNVALGHNAGYWETGSNHLWIDNNPRLSLADAKITALIYGVFDVNPVNQILNINGQFTASQHSAFCSSVIDILPPLGPIPICLNVGETLTTSTDLIGIASYLSVEPIAPYVGLNTYAGVFMVEVPVGNAQDFSNSNLNGIRNSVNYNGTNAGNSGFLIRGTFFEVNNNSTGRINNAFGIAGGCFNNGAGTIDFGVGFYAEAENTGSGNMGICAALAGNCDNYGTGTITIGAGLVIPTPLNNGGGVISTLYGIWIQDMSGIAGVGTAYNIYSAGPASINKFDGKVGIGTGPSPTANLEIYGGTGTTLQIVDTNQGVGKVLTSDAAGIASWSKPLAGIPSYQNNVLALAGGLVPGDVYIDTVTYVGDGLLKIVI